MNGLNFPQFLIFVQKVQNEKFRPQATITIPRLQIKFLLNRGK